MIFEVLYVCLVDVEREDGLPDFNLYFIRQRSVAVRVLKYSVWASLKSTTGIFNEYCTTGGP